MLAAGHEAPAALPQSHPNEFDMKRIARLLGERKRYRYVSPEVVPAEGGYRIVSPCCSRSVDPDGGKVDVALFTRDLETGNWTLFFLDDSRRTWIVHSHHRTLGDVVDCLNKDPSRRFWR